jgi:hypothetical protein
VFDTVTFCGLSNDSYVELLSLLLTSIFDDFAACPCPKIYIAKATSGNPLSDNHEQDVVLVSTNNLGHYALHFADQDLSFCKTT